MNPASLVNQSLQIGMLTMLIFSGLHQQMMGDLLLLNTLLKRERRVLISGIKQKKYLVIKQQRLLEILRKVKNMNSELLLLIREVRVNQVILRDLSLLSLETVSFIIIFFVKVIPFILTEK